MSQNPKIPHSEATTIARTVYEALKPFTTAFTFAGSLRRKQPFVGDIEAVVLPTLDTVPDGFFGTKEIRSRDFVMTVHKLGTVIVGDPVNGRYVRMNVGGKLLNPEARSKDFKFDGGIQFDLFIPKPENYGMRLAICTGPRNYSSNVLAKKWKAMGWCGVDGDLRRQTQCIDHGKGDNHDWKLKAGLQNIQMPPVFDTELQFFQFLGLEYVEPKFRV